MKRPGGKDSLSNKFEYLLKGGYFVFVWRVGTWVMDGSMDGRVECRVLRRSGGGREVAEVEV